MTDYLYTGQELDSETGLYNYKVRFYDSRLGRFYSSDPAGQFASPYLYAGGDPINFIDPSGMMMQGSGGNRGMPVGLMLVIWVPPLVSELNSLLTHLASARQQTEQVIQQLQGELQTMAEREADAMLNIGQEEQQTGELAQQIRQRQSEVRRYIERSQNYIHNFIQPQQEYYSQVLQQIVAQLLGQQQQAPPQ